MKKYLSLLVVFLMIFVLGNHLAQAKDSEDDSDSSDNIKLETSGKIEVKTEIEDKDSDNDGIEDVEDQNDDNNGKNDDVDTDTKIKREELKKEFEAKREEVKKQIEAIREEAKTKMEALRESIKGEKNDAKAKVKELRIEGRERALERFDNAILRISELKDRINAQILKLEVKGVNVVNAKNFVATSETKLTAARNKIVEINALLVLSINELTIENKTKLKTLAKETQTLIIEAHTALKEAVGSLKTEIKIKMEAEANISE